MELMFDETVSASHDVIGLGFLRNVSINIQLFILSLLDGI